MKKKLFCLAAIFLAAACLLMGCSDNTTLAKFDVPASVESEIGSAYVIGRVTATDSSGTVLQADVSVVDAQGNPVEVSGNEFKVTSMDGYTITYTVAYGKNGQLTETKTTKVSVFDLTDPEILHADGLGEDTYAPEGGTLDLSKFSARDNSGEDVAVEIQVQHNGQAVTLSGNTLELTQSGTYQITAAATDSSDNTASRTFHIHTGAVLDAESGISFQDLDDWFTCSISQDFARSGESSYRIDLFGLQANWFRDKGVFGQTKTMTDSSYKYLTYWVYFDIAGADLNAAVVWKETEKAERYDFKLYDEFGNELQSAQNTDHTNIEMVKGTEGRWVRVVVNAQNKINHATGAAIADSGFMDLGDYEAYLGVWDYNANDGAGGEATVAIPTYFDDIQLVKDDAALAALLETGWTGAPDRDAAIIADYETAADIRAFEGCQASRTTEVVHSGEYALALSGWGEQGWITANKLFAAGSGGTAVKLWVYVPTFPGTTAEETVPLLKAKSGEDFLRVTSVTKEGADGSLQSVAVRSNEQGSYAELCFDAWHQVEIRLNAGQSAADLDLVFEFWSPSFTTLTAPYIAYIDDVTYSDAAVPAPAPNPDQGGTTPKPEADTTAPVLSCVLGDLNGLTFPEGQPFDAAIFTATDNVDKQVTPVVTVTKDGAPFEFHGYAELPAGNYVITVNASDNAGNQAAPLVFAITVGNPATEPEPEQDTVAPVLSCVLGDLNGLTFPVGQALDAAIFTATDNVDAQVLPVITITKDGADFPFNGYAELPAGSYVITVNAADAAGNQAIPLVFAITVEAPDSTAPVIGCTVEGLNGASFPAGTPLDAGIFFANDPEDGVLTPTVTVKKDGSDFPFNGYAELTQAGVYAITVEAVDKAGNKAAQTYTVTVFLPDTIAPILTCTYDGLYDGAVFPAGTYFTTAIFTAVDDVDGTLVPVVTVSVNGEAPFVFGGDTNLQPGSYHITVTAKDAAGNEAAPLIYNITVAAQDTTAPVLSCTFDGLTDGAVFPAGAWFSTDIFTATDDVDGLIVPTVTVSVNGEAPFPFAGATQLQPGRYLITVTAKDAAGNEATPLVYNITVS